MKNLLGANYKSTLTAGAAALFSFLTVLAALPYSMGDISTIFPPEWKGKVAVAGAVAALLLKFWNGAVQKDRDVTGGVVQQDAQGNVAKPQEPTPPPPAAAVPESPKAGMRSTVRPNGMSK